jgi:hypothetical protein
MKDRIKKITDTIREIAITGKDFTSLTTGAALLSSIFSPPTSFKKDKKDFYPS